MASNFRILIRRNNGDLHLKLKGDFDGSSAFELINTLNAHIGKVGKIVVDTSGLSHVHPFGMDMFLENCSLIRRPSHALYFTGKFANTLENKESEVVC